MQRRFDTDCGEWGNCDDDRFCNFFDLGGRVDGQSTSTSSQTADVSFIPTVLGSASQPLVSSYPAGQGLATLNSAYPASAAYQSIYGDTTTTAAAQSSGLTVSDYLIFAAVAAAAWYFLRHKR